MRDIWITNEIPARCLFVHGRSAIDPDCLVAYAEGDNTKPLWIVDHGGDEGAVCGLSSLDEPMVRARRVKE